MVFDGSNDELNNFLVFINSLHTNVNFALEDEAYNSINFLYLNTTDISKTLFVVIYDGMYKEHLSVHKI